MSERNVEIVRDGYVRFREKLDFQEEIMAPDFVWDMSTFRDWPEDKTYAGLDGARRFMSDWLEAWSDWKLDVEELRDVDDARVLAIVHQTGRSKASGLDVDMRFAQLWTLRDGVQVRMEMYATPEDAFEALGLDE